MSIKLFVSGINYYTVTDIHVKTLLDMKNWDLMTSLLEKREMRISLYEKYFIYIFTEILQNILVNFAYQPIHILKSSL